MTKDNDIARARRKRSLDRARALFDQLTPEQKREYLEQVLDGTQSRGYRGR